MLSLVIALGIISYCCSLGVAHLQISSYHRSVCTQKNIVCVVSGLLVVSGVLGYPGTYALQVREDGCNVVYENWHFLGLHHTAP